jgi:hypothetical protein
VEPQLAQGKLSTLWIAFAKMYEERGDLTQARETAPCLFVSLSVAWGCVGIWREGLRLNVFDPTAS